MQEPPDGAGTGSGTGSLPCPRAGLKPLVDGTRVFRTVSARSGSLPDSAAARKVLLEMQVMVDFLEDPEDEGYQIPCSAFASYI